MIATGIPAEVALLMLPILGAIGFVWYLAWRALKSFQTEETAGSVAPTSRPRPGDRDARRPPDRTPAAFVR